jgi:hypothetical protein
MGKSETSSAHTILVSLLQRVMDPAEGVSAVRSPMG